MAPLAFASSSSRSGTTARCSRLRSSRCALNCRAPIARLSRYAHHVRANEPAHHSQVPDTDATGPHTWRSFRRYEWSVHAGESCLFALRTNQSAAERAARATVTRPARLGRLVDVFVGQI
jgi:hypothetical protein